MEIAISVRLVFRKYTNANIAKRQNVNLASKLYIIKG